MADIGYFKCMMCGHDWEEEVEKGVDIERSCPQCRSNSIRQFRSKPEPKE